MLNKKSDEQICKRSNNMYPVVQFSLYQIGYRTAFILSRATGTASQSGSRKQSAIMYTEIVHCPSLSLPKQKSPPKNIPVISILFQLTPPHPPPPPGITLKIGSSGVFSIHSCRRLTSSDRMHKTGMLSLFVIGVEDQEEKKSLIKSFQSEMMCAYEIPRITFLTIHE